MEVEVEAKREKKIFYFCIVEGKKNFNEQEEAVKKSFQINFLSKSKAIKFVYERVKKSVKGLSKRVNEWVCVQVATDTWTLLNKQQ